MDLTKFAEFLIALKRRTNNGLLEWREDGSERFAVDVKSVRVTLSVSASETSIDEDYLVTIDALPEGDTIVSYTDVELKDYLRGSFAFLKGLYSDARMSAKGYKKRLDEALDAFSDDIPF